jgi:galactokinase
MTHDGELRDAARAGFESCYDTSPEWLSIAPGRINLIGDHTDYNAGLALPLALPRHIIIAAGRGTEPHRINARSAGHDTAISIDLSSEPLKNPAGWGAYIAGVAQGAITAGIEIPALDVWIQSDLPSGAGLSSSAALSVGWLTLLDSIAGKGLSTADKIAITQAAEHDYAGTPCGILDMFSIINAQENKLMLLDCRSATAEQIPWPDASAALLIIDSGVKHSNASGNYAKRRAECEAAEKLLGKSLRDTTLDDIKRAQKVAGQTADKTLIKRARHVSTENERVRQTAIALAGADWRTAGQLLYASHSSMADDFKVSCLETDLLVQLASRLGTDAGIYGARMTGAGFGGAVVALVDGARLEDIGAQLAARYEKACGLKPEWLRARPVAGARMVDL